MISKEDLNELLEVANKATPGPWQAINGDNFSGSCIEGISEQGSVDVIINDGSYGSWHCGVETQKDALFIAQANPQVIIALVEELLKLREANKWYKGVLEIINRSTLIETTPEDVQLLRNLSKQVKEE